ncbi:MAG: hypothetical protein D6812_10300 [Deltaproteobacteria bacterium]|nr:MAG: hypothetical protein D6812_10300 [Deltaproteobacteria bacterium]
MPLGDFSVIERFLLPEEPFGGDVIVRHPSSGLTGEDNKAASSSQRNARRCPFFEGFCDSGAL